LPLLRSLVDVRGVEAEADAREREQLAASGRGRGEDERQHGPRVWRMPSDLETRAVLARRREARRALPDEGGRAGPPLIGVDLLLEEQGAVGDDALARGQPAEHADGAVDGRADLDDARAERVVLAGDDDLRLLALVDDGPRRDAEDLLLARVRDLDL